MRQVESTFQRVIAVLSHGDTAQRGILTLAGLLLAQTAFVCATYREWHTMGLLAAVVVLSVLAREFSREEVLAPLDRRSPSNFKITIGMLVMLSVMMALRFPKTLSESPNYVQIGLDVLAHTSLLSSLFIWAMYPRRGHVSLLFLGLFLVLLCVGAGGVSRSLAAQTTVGVLSGLGFLIASRIIISASYLRDQNSDSHESGLLGAPWSEQREAASKKRTRAGFAAIVLLMMATGAVASVTDRVLPGIQQRLQDQLEASLDPTTRQTVVGGMGYVRGSHLGDIRKRILVNPAGVALRVYSKQKPGYLRGMVFDHYSDRDWKSHGRRSRNQSQMRGRSLTDRAVEPQGKSTTKLESASGMTLNRFNLREPTADQVTTLEIRGEHVVGSQVFLPLSTRWLEASSSELTVSLHGQIKTGVNLNAPYVAGATISPPSESISQAQTQFTTSLTAYHRKRLTPLAEDVCIGTVSARDKAAAVSRFFQSNFTYSTDLPEIPAFADPVVNFLEQRHPAHCEYFATSTVLLLRCVGVPTRYVTGYVSDELVDDMDSSDPHWVARNRDAHAWTEAYDEVAGAWFAVESTPGFDYVSVNPALLAAQTSERGDDDSEFEDSDSDSLLARILGWVMSSRATDTFFSVFRYLQIVVLVGLVVWLINRFRRRVRSEDGLWDRQSRRLLAKVDRYVRRKGYTRQVDESLYRFADRLTSEAEKSTKLRPRDQDRLQRAAAWMKTFADARYQGLAPPDFDLDGA